MTEPITLKARARRILPMALVVAAFLVPAGAGIAVGATLLAPPPAAAPASAQSAAPTPSPTPVVEAPYEFSSVSGNLRCRIDAVSAWCHQGEYTYQPDYLNCAAEGVAVGVTAKEAYWPCLGARPALSPSVAYDTPVVHGEFTCLINLATGVRCTNAAGSGFTIEYSAGTTTF